MYHIEWDFEPKHKGKMKRYWTGFGSGYSTNQEAAKRFPTLKLAVTPREGITLSSLTNDVKSAISAYINALPVGGDVIVSDIICAVKDVSGVFDVTMRTPTENIAIADNELARIDERDIIVG